MLPAAHAAEPIIGVVGPLSGSSRILGEQIVAGAFVASRATGAKLVTADDQCSAAGGKDAARRVIERKVSAVVGFLCTEALEAALPLFKDARIPVITVGVRTDSLTDRHDRTQWPLLRLAPRADAEAAAVASTLTRLWREQNFAIVDDGTIGGRQLAEAFRAEAEQAGLKPVFIDTYRPDLENQVALVGRLRRAGATHVLVGGNRQDIAIISRDAAARDYDLTVAGGESLRDDDSDVPLAPGTLMIGLPEWSEIAARSAMQALAARAVIAEGYVLPAYAAVETATAAPPAEPTGDPIAGFVGRDFVTALGTLRFDAKGDLTRSPYRPYRYDGRRFVEVEGE